MPRILCNFAEANPSNPKSSDTQYSYVPNSCIECGRGLSNYRGAGQKGEISPKDRPRVEVGGKGV